MNDKYWQELMEKLDVMSDEEFAVLVDECDKQPDLFAIEQKEGADGD